MLLILLGACTDQASSSNFVPAEFRKGPGVYYWKTSWAVSAADQNALIRSGARQFFLRLFDVDWDFNKAKPRPLGMLQLPGSLALDTSLSITPVVFIVERVFRQDVDIEGLAKQISSTILGMSAVHPELANASRWQIDCDWTPASRNSYFAFLKALQQQNPDLILNATIRLHQYRERQNNGVPPVPEGLLMCYNMEPVQESGTTNAIYREDLLRGYLKAPPYPIPLDAALPVFEWGAAFRDERFLGIIASPSLPSAALQEISSGRFLVLRDTTIDDIFLRGGDNIRHDGAGGKEVLNVAVELLKQRSEVRDLLVFDWPLNKQTKYPLGEIWEAFYR